MAAQCVAIVGGGPTGLCLALELGRRQVRCVLFDEKDDTTRHPQANATQARTMEHFRRLGIAEEIRALGLPRDYPTDIAYFTRYSRYELARLRLPASGAVAELARRATGSWSTPELPHRCSQMYIERVLKQHAARLPTVTLNYGWRVTALREHRDFVEVQAEPVGGGAPIAERCAYLVGCDGPRSMVRSTLDIDYVGEAGAVRDFLGGTMWAVHLRCPDLYARLSAAPAWMYWAFNRDRRALMAALNGVDEFVFHTQLREAELGMELHDSHARALFEQALGQECPIEVLYQRRWIAGHALVAQRYGSERIFLAGDAAHLFTPTGGLGYNTGVDDVANLGWKLAAVLSGYAGPALLASYAAERLPVGVRNTGIARNFADSIGLFVAGPRLEEESAEGDRVRAEAGRYLQAHAEREFDIPGATFGVRYDGSPLIWTDAPAPPDAVNEYRPSGVPGGRAPHLWVGGSQSLYDLLGPELTLLRLEPQAQTEAWRAAARARVVPLQVLDLAATDACSEARELYGAQLALIRPDQHIAWRGSDRVDPASVLERALGWS